MLSRWSKFIKSELSPKEDKGPQTGDLIGTEMKEVVVDGVAHLVQVQMYQGDKAPNPKVKCKGSKVRKGPAQIKLPKGVA